MSINVKTHGNHLPWLDIELVDAVNSEYFETTFLGILFECLENIRCYFPLAAVALGYASSFWEDKNNLS